MEAIKRYWFWGILISILSVFAMSYNANAIESVFDISNYEYSYYSRLPSYTCYYSDGTSSSGNYCQINYSRNLVSIGSEDIYNLKAGDIVETYIMAFSDSSFITGETISGNLSGNLYVRSGVNSYRGDVLSVEPITLHSDSQVTTYYDYWNLRQIGTGHYISGYPEITTGYQHFSIYKILVRINRDFNTSGGNFTLEGSNANPLVYYAPVYDSSINVYFPYFKVWRPTESKENREQEQKTQEAADASETVGGSSSTDAQQGTTSLINAITGAVTVISSASPTNCKINGNMGNLDIGQLDLCANPAPAFVTTIGSLILILMCVPLAITLFNRFISLFRSFQS